MTRVTLDTNELISAFNFRGKALELIHRAINGEIEIAISEPILIETMRVLRDKFEWNPYELRALYDRLIKICKLLSRSTPSLRPPTTPITAFSNALRKRVRSSSSPKTAPCCG